VSEPAFDRLLAGLATAEIRFVLVGGLALGSWGVIRGTKDVDVVADPDPENLRRLAALAVELSGQVETGEAFLSSEPSIAVALTSGDRVYIETALGPLDVVQGLAGVPSYTELRSRAKRTDVLGTEVWICSLDHLRAMKRAAGRTRDLADLEDLDTAHGAD